MRPGSRALAQSVAVAAAVAGLIGLAGPANAAIRIKLPPGGETFKVGGHPGAIVGVFSGGEQVFVTDGSNLDELTSEGSGVHDIPMKSAVNSVAYDSFTQTIWVSSPAGTLTLLNYPKTFQVPDGSGPIVADPHTDVIWITNPSAGTVAGFDESEQTILTTIHVGADVGPIADDPVTETVWVASDHGYVSEVSEVSDTVTAKVPVARGPKPGVITGLAVDQQSGTVWVTSYQPGAHAATLPGRLTEISATSHKVLATMPVGPKPSAVAAQWQTGTVWVTVPGQDRLQLVDERPLKVTGSFATGADPVSVSPEFIGKNVWVSDHQDGTVTGYNFVTPVFHSRAHASATVGHSFTFTVQALGPPAPTLTMSGKLPEGVRATVTPGMIKLTGTPAASAAHRTFHLTVSAGNGIGDRSDRYNVVQHLVITVSAGSQS
jgi:DNA-binding beta-propeller fold protein YncE